MTDSSGPAESYDDIPPSVLTASHLVTDHDVAARIARGHNMLRRTVDDPTAVARLVADLTDWSSHNYELLAKRFADGQVATAYSAVAEPFVVPAESAPVEAQIDLLQRQLRHQVEWLERLRLTIPERQQPAIARDQAKLKRQRGARRSAAVVATTASATAAAVVGAVARATGILPAVVEHQKGERRSLVRAAQRMLPTNAVGVVVLEPPDEGSSVPSPSSFLALGYAAGALGPNNVIAVSAPDVTDLGELSGFTTVMMDPADEWRDQLEMLLTEAGLTMSAVVSALRPQ